MWWYIDHYEWARVLCLKIDFAIFIVRVCLFVTYLLHETACMWVFASVFEHDMYVLTLISVSVPPRVTAVARKRPWSFCQKCRWQVTAKHAYTLRMWLCMKWHGAWLYGVLRTRRDWRSLAADSCGTSHASAVRTPLRWILKKSAIKSYSLM